MNLDKKIGDPDVSSDIFKKELDEPKLVEKEIGDKKVQFTFGAKGGVDVQLLNDINDKDADEVFGNDTALIPFEAAKGWLKYKSFVGIKTGAGVELGKLGFKFSMTRDISSSVYRKHNADEIIGQAILNDFQTFKSIFSVDGIERLDKGEAVSFSTAGTMEASLKVAWSDVFSANISKLGSLLGNNELFKIKIDAEAFASFKLSIEDDFLVKIVKTGNNKYQLIIDKDVSTKKTGSVGAKIGAAFEDPEEIQKVAKELIEAFFDEKEKKIEDLVNTKVADITDEQKEMVIKIAERLGWVNETNPLKKLKEEYESLKEKLIESAKKFAESKVQLSFSFDYTKVSSRDVLIKAETNIEGIRKFHTQILCLRVDPIMTSIRENEGVFSNATFMDKKVTERVKSSGLSIGFGKWSAGSDKEQSLKKSVVKNEKNQKQISYDSKRTYGEKVGKNDIEWAMNMEATMPNMTTEVPLANDFDYSLYMSQGWTEKKLTKTELMQCLDLASIWGIISIDERNSECERIFQMTKNLTSIKVKCELTFEHQAFNQMLFAFHQPFSKPQNFAEALSLALPYWEGYAIREDPERRRQAYTPLWTEFLGHGNAPLASSSYANSAYSHLTSIGGNKLGKAELNYNQNGFIHFESFATTINRSSYTFRKWLRLVNGFEKLAKGKDASSTLYHHQVIPEAFDMIQDFWLKEFHFRTLGVMLAMVADQFPHLKEHVNRTMKIEFKEKQKEKVEVIAMSR